MDTFTDPRTALAFPAKIGSWVRRSVTTYPLQSAGYSVIYELRGWFGRRKALVSVDVYDKACPDIPAGPHSAHVAIELHNCIHAMFPNVPPVDASKIDSYLGHPDVASKALVGKIDATGRIRSAGGELTMNGVSFYFAVYLLGHRHHFVKFQESDLTKGACSSEVSAVLEFFLTQMRDQEATGNTPWGAAILAECASADAILDEALEPRRAAERPLILAALQSLLAHAAWRALTVAMPEEAFSICSALCEHLAGRSRLPHGHFPNVWAVVFQLLSQQPTTAKNAESLWARVAFALGDAGYDAPHIYDCLWVQYTVLVYPNFNIRVFEAAGGRNTQLRPTPDQLASALATANAKFRAQFQSLAEKVMGDKIGDAEFRRTFGAVLIEKNLREIQGIDK